MPSKSFQVLGDSVGDSTLSQSCCKFGRLSLQVCWLVQQVDNRTPARYQKPCPAVSRRLSQGPEFLEMFFWWVGTVRDRSSVKTHADRGPRSFRMSSRGPRGVFCGRRPSRSPRSVWTSITAPRDIGTSAWAWCDVVGAMLGTSGSGRVERDEQ